MILTTEEYYEAIKSDEWKEKALLRYPLPQKGNVLFGKTSQEKHPDSSIRSM